MHFIGQYTHSVDEKGRIAIPAKFRSAFSKGAVVTRGLDKALFLYTKKSWQDMAEKINELPLSGKDSRAFARLMLSGAMEVAPDKQGRIVIPEYLRSYAGIREKAVVMGTGDRLEVWDEKAWQKYQHTMEAKGDEIAERLSELGI